jgi:hypothetical protein
MEVNVKKGTKYPNHFTIDFLVAHFRIFAEFGNDLFPTFTKSSYFFTAYQHISDWSTQVRTVLNHLLQTYE